MKLDTFLLVIRSVWYIDCYDLENHRFYIDVNYGSVTIFNTRNKIKNIAYLYISCVSDW